MVRWCEPYMENVTSLHEWMSVRRADGDRNYGVPSSGHPPISNGFLWLLFLSSDHKLNVDVLSSLPSQYDTLSSGLTNSQL